MKTTGYEPPAVYELFAYNYNSFGGESIEVHPFGRIEIAEHEMAEHEMVSEQVARKLVLGIGVCHYPVIEVKKNTRAVYLVIRPEANKLHICKILQKYFGQRSGISIKVKKQGWFVKLLRQLGFGE